VCCRTDAKRETKRQLSIRRRTRFAWLDRALRCEGAHQTPQLKGPIGRMNGRDGGLEHNAALPAGLVSRAGLAVLPVDCAPHLEPRLLSLEAANGNGPQGLQIFRDRKSGAH
jgi:hypothetical protein